MIPGLAAYASVTFVFAVTPGATTAVVVRNAIEGGWFTGVRTSAGAAAGNACQAIAAGLGLAVLVRQLPRVWVGVQIAGALYLAWLGAQSLARMWRGTTRAASAAANGVPSTRTALRQGLFANLLNPSIGTFYLAILPSFLPASAPPRLFALFALVHITIAFVCHCAWAGAFDRLRALFVQPAFARLVEGLAGGALLWLAWRMFVRV